MAAKNLKLYPELKPLIEKIRQNKVGIQRYGERLQAAGGYNDYATRFAWDVLRAFIPCWKICEWYEQYSCNDNHITALAIAACKEAGVL